MRYLGGSALRKRREALHLSRPKLIRLLRKSGVQITVRTLQNWEANENPPDADCVAALATAMNMSLSELFVGNGK